MENQSLRSCPLDVRVVKDFDVNKYLGEWFEIERFPFAQEEGLRCVKATYSLNGDGSIKVINSGRSKANGNIVSIKGFATAGDDPAKLKVTFPPGPPGPYWVLATDYNNYSLVWSCTDTDDRPLQSIAWILSRNREGLCHERMETLKDILRGFRIDPSPFIKTDQTNCD